MSRKGRRVLQIKNRTRETVLAERGAVADRPWSRMKGLLGRDRLDSGQGLVIRPCQGVHTWFMSFPIDVLHVDREGAVLAVLSELGPWRLGPVIWPTQYVVELPAGTAASTGTIVGDHLELVERWETAEVSANASVGAA